MYLEIISDRILSRILSSKGRATTAAAAVSDTEESSESEDFSIDDYSNSEDTTGDDDDGDAVDADGTSSHAQHSSEDEASSNSSDAESSCTSTQSVRSIDPVLTRIHGLLKRVRSFVTLVAKSSRVHEYIRQKRKENKLPGQVSGSKRH